MSSATVTANFALFARSWSDAATPSDQIESLAARLSPTPEALPFNLSSKTPAVLNTSTASASSTHRSLGADLISFPQYSPTAVRPGAFLVLAEWEGSVLEVGADGILAGLVPIRGLGNDEEAQGEIPWDEIADGDRDLVQPGALFRLSVGYEISSGTRTRFSRVIFRRLPAWTAKELESADEIAIHQFNAIPVE
jgi:hypothetical protein